MRARLLGCGGGGPAAACRCAHAGYTAPRLKKMGWWRGHRLLNFRSLWKLIGEGNTGPSLKNFNPTGHVGGAVVCRGVEEAFAAPSQKLTVSGDSPQTGGHADSRRGARVGYTPAGTGALARPRPAAGDLRTLPINQQHCADRRWNPRRAVSCRAPSASTAKEGDDDRMRRGDHEGSGRAPAPA